MLDSGDGLAASDIIRSMMRLGFPREEIYDTLTGMGLPGEQVQLLIDRVRIELEEAKLENRSSQLATEVGRVFGERMEELETALSSRLSSISQKFELFGGKLEKLEARVLELQTMICRMNGPKSKSKPQRKRGTRRAD
jgi:chaperonin cofactor prefoldin